jgi:hypothetical protein
LFVGYLADHGKNQASFFAVCAVLDAWKYLEGRRDKNERDELHTRILAHLAAFKTAYPDELLKPKHHQSMHLVKQLKKLLRILNTLVLERKHKALKRILGSVTNLSSFEAGVAIQFLNEQVHALSQSDHLATGCRLINAKPAQQSIGDLFPGAARVTLSTEAYTHSRFGHEFKVFRKDVVYFNDSGQGSMRVGVVCVHIHADSDFLTVLEVYSRAAENTWVKADGMPNVVDLEDIMGTCIWAEAGPNSLLVLPPSNLVHKLV